MNVKKNLARVLAVALSLCLVTVSFATGEQKVEGGSGTVTQEKSTSLQTPTINVVVNPLAGFVVNPYGMAYTTAVGTGTFAQPTVDSSNTLITFPGLITNKTNSKMVISATAIIKADAGSKVAVQNSFSALSAEENKDKANVFMFLELQNNDTVTDSNYGTIGWTSASDTGISSMSSIFVATTNSNPSNSAKIKMAAATGANGSTPTYAAYNLVGGSSGKGWTSGDKFLVTIAFTFTPVAVFPDTF